MGQYNKNINSFLIFVNKVLSFYSKLKANNGKAKNIYLVYTLLSDLFSRADQK